MAFLSKPKVKMKKIFNYLSSAALIIILLILLVPNWRVRFQGWTQHLFMGDIQFANQPSAKNHLVGSDLWHINDLNGQAVNLLDLPPKPVLISFWATWCPPCRAELVELKKLQEHFGNELIILAVTEESVDKIVASGLDESYSFLYTTNAFPLAYEISAFPTLMLFDKDQLEVFKHTGAGKLSEEKNLSFIKKLIENS
jgi:thiol-disulfide isomerase/thioredoxin